MASRLHLRLAAAVAATALISGIGVLAVPDPAVAALFAQFYVDPQDGDDADDGLTAATAFRSIERARDAVDAVNEGMTGDIVVTLAGGSYALSDPVKFTEDDGGRNGFDVVYRNADGEHPVFTGGVDISSGWTLEDAGRGIWSRDFGSDVETRQLFVDGERATRARSLSELDATASAGVPGSVMKTWGNLDDVENVYVQRWVFHRVSVDHVAADDSIVLDSPGAYFHTAYNPGAYWYTENAYELLDEPGEWYLDRPTDTFFYKPLPGQAMNSVDVTVPVLEDLFVLGGSDLDHPITDIRFEGLGFEHTTWLRPSSDRGFIAAQNGVIREAKQPTDPDYDGGAFYSRHDWIDAHAAIRVQTAARGIVIDGCDFRRLGAIGVLFLRGTRDSTVTGSTFVDLAGQAVQIGGDDIDMGVPDHYYPDDAREILSGFSIVENYIERTGRETFNAAAIGASWPKDTDISRNEIFDVPYSGIHVGWGWAYIGGTRQDDTGGLGTSGPGPTENVTIRDNYIHRFMTVLDDGGGIYVLGETHGGNEISGNYLSNMDVVKGTPGEYEYAMIYHDNGASWWLTRDNVIEGNRAGGIISAFGGVDRTNPDNWAHDITIQDIYSAGGHAGVNTTVNTLTGLRVVPDRHYPAAAQAIIASAGRTGHPPRIPGPPVVAEYEAEDLAFTTGGAAASVVAQTDGASGGEWVLLTADGDGDWIEFTLPQVAAGSYTVKIVYKRHSARGTASVEAPSGTAMGPGLDMYSASTGYVSRTLGTFVVAAAGDQTLRFTVTGKNAAASTRHLSFDAIVLEASVLEQDFDTQASGAAPAGWTTGAGGTAALEVASGDAHLVLQKTSGATSFTTYADFSEPLDAGTIQVRARADQANVVSYAVIAKAADGTSAIQVAFGANGEIQYRDPAGWHSTGISYTPGRWYGFAVDFDVATDRYTLRVDDATVVTGVAFMSAVAGIARTGVGVYSTAPGAVARFDEITAYGITP